MTDTNVAVISDLVRTLAKDCMRFVCYTLPDDLMEKSSAKSQTDLLDTLTDLLDRLPCLMPQKRGPPIEVCID